MQITSSYGVEIKKQNIPIRHTLRIYRSAVSYLIRVYAESWEELSQLDNIQKRFNAAEHLVHETKKNRAKYDFDLRFPRLPSYLRRSAIQHVLGRIRRFQREHGSRQVQSRWAYAKRLNTELARRIAAAVTAYAVENRADVIVFEYLEMSGRISGNKKQKLHLWRKRDIQKLCEHQAHRKGIRISRVSARNTSRLAYDGSGAVVRDQGNRSLCTFQTGKRYHCDLSAAYNIGARYFIRELLKPFSETERLNITFQMYPCSEGTDTGSPAL